MAFRTAGGMAFNQAKSIAKFYFSEYFVDGEKDEVNLSFNFWLLPGLEKDFVEYYLEYWNSKQIRGRKAGYNLFLFAPEQDISRESYTPYIKEDNQ
jgi:hypothetical protein